MTNGNNPGSSVSTPDQIATTNATAYLFSGSRMPKWAMPNSAKPHPPRPRSSSRRPTSQATTQTPQQSTPTQTPAPPRSQSVLPSPAPSDEPSPAVSNYLDSPNPVTATLPKAQMVDAVPIVAPNLPVPEARFVLNSNDSNSETNEQCAQRESGQHGLGLLNQLSSPTMPGVTSFGTPTMVARSHTNQNNHASNTRNTSQGWTGSSSTSPHAHSRVVSQGSAEKRSSTANTTRNPINTAEQHAVAGPMARSDSAPPAKRPRIENRNTPAASSTNSRAMQSWDRTLKADYFKTLTIRIDQFKRTCERDSSKLSSAVDRPRLELLRKACVEEDDFFVMLNQLFTMWADKSQEVYHVLRPTDAATIDGSFSQLQDVLKTSDELGALARTFFSHFPESLEPASQQELTGYPASVQRAQTYVKVGTFLQRMHAEWPRRLQQTVQRGYPFLVDELHLCLQCRSTVLQEVLFRASRRGLNYPDGTPETSELSRLFHQDQACRYPAGVYQQPTAPDELQERNRELSTKYLNIMATSATRYFAEEPAMGPSPTPSNAMGPSPTPSNAIGPAGQNNGTQGSWSSALPSTNGQAGQGNGNQGTRMPALPNGNGQTGQGSGHQGQSPALSHRSPALSHQSPALSHQQRPAPGVQAEGSAQGSWPSPAHGRVLGLGAPAGVASPTMSAGSAPLHGQAPAQGQGPGARLGPPQPGSPIDLTSSPGPQSPQSPTLMSWSGFSLGLPELNGQQMMQHNGPQNMRQANAGQLVPEQQGAGRQTPRQQFIRQQTGPQMGQQLSQSIGQQVGQQVGQPNAQTNIGPPGMGQQNHWQQFTGPNGQQMASQQYRGPVQNSQHRLQQQMPTHVQKTHSSPVPHNMQSPQLQQTQAQSQMHSPQQALRTQQQLPQDQRQAQMALQAAVASQHVQQAQHQLQHAQRVQAAQQQRHQAQRAQAAQQVQGPPIFQQSGQPSSGQMHPQFQAQQLAMHQQALMQQQRLQGQQERRIQADHERRFQQQQHLLQQHQQQMQLQQQQQQQMQTAGQGPVPRPTFAPQYSPAAQSQQQLQLINAPRAPRPMAPPAGRPPQVNTVFFPPQIRRPDPSLASFKRDQALDEGLVPRFGRLIPRSEWAQHPCDENALRMSLHQAHVRSPKRAAGVEDKERFYQAVKSLPVPPTVIKTVNEIFSMEFDVTKEQMQMAVYVPGGIVAPLVDHMDGSLRWRLRCCKPQPAVDMMSEADWVTTDSTWPQHIFMRLNGMPLTPRRKTHNGKDLPTELTANIKVGKNVVQVGLASPSRKKETGVYFVAVEVVETLSHSSILDLVNSTGRVPAPVTLNVIKKRLTAANSEDDDDLVVQVPDLSIDLADPFSSVLFKTPARGNSCTHLECFDLELWLQTRPPTKSAVTCLHSSDVRCTCPRYSEPSNPDKWKCPICFKDARPYSLRIDEFLVQAREQLEREGKLTAKSMTVAADGSFRAVLPVDDNDEDDEDVVRKTPAPPVFTVPARKSSVMEVIEIDDD